MSLTILLEWQLNMYPCVLYVRYVLLYALVRQNKRCLLTYLLLDLKTCKKIVLFIKGDVTTTDLDSKVRVT